MEESHIQLHKFLEEGTAARLAKQIHDMDEADAMFVSAIPAYESGVGGGWQMRGPTHKQRYLEATGDAKMLRGEPCALVELKTECFGTEAFRKLLSYMARASVDGCRQSVRRFRPGLDYTLAHSEVETTGYQLDATLCFVEESEPTSPWGLGEVGGESSFLSLVAQLRLRITCVTSLSLPGPATKCVL